MWGKWRYTSKMNEENQHIAVAAKLRTGQVATFD
jgi:hypothetical protein